MTKKEGRVPDGGNSKDKSPETGKRSAIDEAFIFNKKWDSISRQVKKKKLTFKMGEAGGFAKL